MITVSTDSLNVVKEVVEVLQNGGLVIYPTETCYGVGVDATNADSVKKLLKYKKRPSGKAISIAVSSLEMAKEYVEINQRAEEIFNTLLPGPFTIVCKSKHKTDKRLEAENGTLGVRIPNYKLLIDIINKFGKPITATSANSSGAKTPYSLEEVYDTLSNNQKKLIDLAIDGGKLPKNPPSTVIDTTTEELTIYRHGRLNPKNIKRIQNFISDSEEDTISIAENLVKQILEQNTSTSEYFLFLLDGELGSGKTHFAKGIAKALGINKVIKSPSYNYVNEYPVPGSQRKLFHIDAWKLQDRSELETLNILGILNNYNVIIIEWPTVVFNLDPIYLENLSYVIVEFVILEANKRMIRVIENTK
ncbi:MAG: L-threonylcarbamoyladenylate synthase [Candidatus Dojkabacteria bacterium]|nr:L-threonylcarbamoyladenylate synthase [Candidatus Dojkabacteria bacterium]